MANNKQSIPRNPLITEQAVWFVIAFAVIFLESAVLVTSPVWEGSAPEWAKSIISQRNHLLATAAAVTMLLALLMAWNPSGLPKYATLGSGVLSLAAALHSIDIDSLITGLAFLSFASPMYVVMIPTIRWPEHKVDWFPLFGIALFLSLATLSAILGIPPLETIIAIGFDSIGDVILVSVFVGILFCTSIIGVRLIVSIVVAKTSDPRARFFVFWTASVRPRMHHLLERRESRGSRRRRERERRRDSHR